MGASLGPVLQGVAGRSVGPSALLSITTGPLTVAEGQGFWSMWGLRLTIVIKDKVCRVL